MTLESDDPRFPETKDGCFASGTLVWTEKGKVPIERLKVGDRVLSRPEAGGEAAYRSVTATYRFEQKALWKLEYLEVASSDTHHLVVTPNHPIWVKGIGWTAVEAIELGQSLLLQDGTEAVATDSGPIWQTREPGVGLWFSDHIGERLGPTVDLNGEAPVWDYETDGGGQSLGDWGYTPMLWRVFNIEVEGYHTYFVGDVGLWVHNVDCGALRVSGALHLEGQVSTLFT